MLICFTYEQSAGSAGIEGWLPMQEGRGPATPPVLTDAGLRGAVVIVTGGGSGIGAATARQLGSVGAPVVLAGRREGPLNEVAAQMVNIGSSSGTLRRVGQSVYGMTKSALGY